MKNIFSYIWNLNGVLIFLALSVGGYTFLKEVVLYKNVRNVVSTEKDVEQKQMLSFGYLQKIPNTPYGILPLLVKQSYGQNYYTKNTQSVRNFLFTNIKTSQNFWLLPTNTNLILDHHFLYIDDKNAKAIMYEIIKNDTNNDKRKSPEDKKILSISMLDGSEYKELVKGVDKYLGYDLEDEVLMVFYEKDFTSYVLEVSLDGFVPVKNTILSKINKSS